MHLRGHTNSLKQAARSKKNKKKTTIKNFNVLNILKAPDNVDNFL